MRLSETLIREVMNTHYHIDIKIEFTIYDCQYTLFTRLALGHKCPFCHWSFQQIQSYQSLEDAQNKFINPHTDTLEVRWLNFCVYKVWHITKNSTSAKTEQKMAKTKVSGFEALLTP